MSWEESKRLDKDFAVDGSVGINGDADSQGASTTGEEGEERSTRKQGNRRFDPECYDDRPFYSMLLKVRLQICTFNSCHLCNRFHHVCFDWIKENISLYNRCPCNFVHLFNPLLHSPHELKASTANRTQIELYFNLLLYFSCNLSMIYYLSIS